MQDMTAIFDNDDFERWWLHGRARNDRVSQSDQDELFENCLYLCESEGRVLAQTHEELRQAIASWAEDWNA